MYSVKIYKRQRNYRDSKTCLVTLYAIVNSSVQCLTEVRYVTSDQHKESSKSRIERDLKDTKTVFEFLEERIPFSPDTSLRNVVTGLTAAKSVNVDRAKEIGHRTFDFVTGKKVD